MPAPAASYPDLLREMQEGFRRSMSASWGDVSDTSPASPLELPASPLEDAPPLEGMESPLELSVSDTSLEDAPLEARLDDTIVMEPVADSPTRRPPGRRARTAPGKHGRLD